MRLLLATLRTTDMIDLPSWRITESNGLHNFSGNTRFVHLDCSNIVGTVQSNHVTKATVSNMTGNAKEVECESVRVMQINETHIVFSSRTNYRCTAVSTDQRSQLAIQ
jgi:hypothetical protein